MINIKKIFDDVFSLLNPVLQIVSITDITGNVYTVEYSVNQKQRHFLNLKPGEFVEITGTPNFNGKHKIITVNNGLNLLQISLKAGLTVTTLGTIKQLAPYFQIGKENEVPAIVSSYQTSNSNNYPLFWLYNNYKLAENLIGYETDLTCFLISQTTDKSLKTTAFYDSQIEILFETFERIKAAMVYSNWFLLANSASYFEYEITPQPLFVNNIENKNVMNEYTGALIIQFKNLTFLTNKC